MGCCNKKKTVTKIYKLKSILTGWRNVIWPDPIVEEIALQRAEVCAGCDLNDDNWCKDCKCYIPAKARSLAERCILWEDIDRKYDL